MKLNDTAQLMNSDNYKERFRAEYFQLDNRISGLSNMLDKYRKNELDFNPTCSIKMLDGQLNAMQIYKTHLVERAKLEDISLEEVVIENNETNEQEQPSESADDESATIDEQKKTRTKKSK